MRLASSFFNALFLLLVSLSVHDCFGQEDVNIGQRVVIESPILDEARGLNISLPHGYQDSNQPYPVLYVLDANTNFKFTAGMVDYLSYYGNIPRMIVVGIENVSLGTRGRDFTPSPYNGGANRYAGSGGADRFLSFLTEELIPHVDATYRTRPFRILVGHSLGGLFACHALMHGNDVFGGFVAISPSLWWNDLEQIPLLEAFAKTQENLNGAMFMSLADEGDQEDVDRFRKLCESMHRDGGADFQCRFREYMDQDHASTAIPATMHALQAMYAGWTLPWETITRGLAAVQEHYLNLGRRFRYDIPMTEQDLHHAACSALVGGFLDEAIEMLEFNLERSPDWLPTYAILAEAWLEKGEPVEARRFAEQALELDPESRKAREILGRLSGD